MSNLLNEAIVDAKALRDAALKNAETIVIEKYSTEVRDTLEKLLEQEEGDPMALDADMGPDSEVPVGGEEMGLPAMEEPLEEGDPSGEEISEDEIPLGATNDFAELNGKNLDSFPADGQDVELSINLGALQESVNELTAALEEEYDISEENIAAMVAEALSGDDSDNMEEGTAVTAATPSIGTADETEAETEEFNDSDDGGLAEGEDDETTTEDTDVDSLVDAVMEKLTVDMGATLSGWAGRSSESMKWEMQKDLAHRRSTDVEEELKDLKKAHEDLVFENNQVAEQNNKYKQATQELKESLHDVNLSNARLLYTNRVLRNASLNERQKNKIVEAISGAGSVAEARTIYDTLQSTVEATPNKRSPQSLSEAIGRRSTVLRATRKEEPSSDPLQDRMKRLAGIK